MRNGHSLHMTLEQQAAYEARQLTARKVVGNKQERDQEAARARSQERHTEVARGGRERVQRPKLREAEVLRACLDILEAHPKVALSWRQNTGAVKLDTRYLKFSFPGASDIMGVMAGSGKFLACECKATGEPLSDDQAAFLANVSRAGGYALRVDDPAYLVAWLENI